VPRLLITTNHLVRIQGSELVTLEIVEHFLGSGWRVELLANVFAPPMADLFERLPHHGNLTVSTDPLSSDEPTHAHDLVWIQHSVVPEWLIRQLQEPGLASPVIWHHMSPIEPTEFPILADLESRIADISTGISPKVLELLESFGIDAARVALFDNPAPDRFSDFPTPRATVPLKRLVVVSNHLPPEVRVAIAILESRGVSVDVLGVEGRSERLEPELLSPYQAVLTIGKTVQYALSMGLPCYVYDRFGGEGWLHADTIEREAMFNFSGRSTGRVMLPGALADEICDGFSEAQKFAVENRQSLAEKWRLSRRIAELLSDPRARGTRLKQLSASEAKRLSALGQLIRASQLVNEKVASDLARSNEHNAELTEQLEMFKASNGIVAAIRWAGRSISHRRTQG
jgi:hypothetical protein